MVDIHLLVPEKKSLIANIAKLTPFGQAPQPPGDASSQIWLNSNQWLRRRSRLKKLLTYGRRTPEYDISSPWSFGPGELINKTT